MRPRAWKTHWDIKIRTWPGPAANHLQDNMYAEQIRPIVAEHARFPHESFAALRAERLLSCYVPIELGGMGLDIAQVSALCEALGHYCGSTAMIFAMHQIQVACIVHHALGTPFFRDYARQIAAKELLIASATTALGIGGDGRSSL